MHYNLSRFTFFVESAEIISLYLLNLSELNYYKQLNIIEHKLKKQYFIYKTSACTTFNKI